MSTDAPTSAPHRTPAAGELRESLGMVLGCDVTVTEAGRTPPEGTIPVAVGPYVDDQNALRGCAWVDLPLGAAMGAALAMAARGQMDASVDAGVLTDEFQDNLHEVLNIASSLLNQEHAAHLRIRSLELLETGLTEDVLDLLADPRAAGYYLVQIAEYGGGLLSFTLG